ncbi:nitroreductase family protein [Thermopolyspora sp. NPDC052614]|uniref:nitroreductase family protein n=1 Tax=Thermopolyspora sp. NPDC052614 TaxID=3155682 RepID=UPI003429FF1A
MTRSPAEAPTSPGEAAWRYLREGERVRPGNLVGVAWSRKPSLVKRYPPASAIQAAGPLADLLRDMCGWTRYQWDSYVPVTYLPELADVALGRPLRPVPSSGGLFSAELYPICDLPGLPVGAYHYDAAAAALNPVRPGVTPAALGVADAKLALLITTVFGRVAFKYGELAYRLQCLDAGVLAGQIFTVLEAAGLRGMLHTRFDEPATAELLGLTPEAERPLAIVTVDGAFPTLVPAPNPAPDLTQAQRPSPAQVRRPSPIAPSSGGSGSGGPGMAVSPFSESGSAAAVPSPNGPGSAASSVAVAPSAGGAAAVPTASTRPLPALDTVPLTRGLCAASRTAAGPDLPPPLTLGVARPGEAPPDDVVALPPVEDRPGAVVAAGRWGRRTLDGRFGIGPITLGQAAAVAAAARHTWQGDAGPGHVLSYCVINDVTGVPRGVYVYDPDGHRLVRTRDGDLREKLWPLPPQRWLHGDKRCGIAVYLVGDYGTGLAACGDRWYQMQNIAAGVVAQRILLAATAAGLSSRLLCATDPAHHAALIALPPAHRALCEILIGPRGPQVAYAQPIGGDLPPAPHSAPTSR